MKTNYIDEIPNLTLMDDVFMSVVFENDTELTEFVLKIILNIDLKVSSVRVQYPIQNLKGRSVRLDIHAVSADGKHFNIEIQQQESGAVARRARYNSSMLDANNLSAGDSFDALPETYVIFVTKTDVLRLGEPIYFIERTILGKNVLFNDEAHIVYVNNSIKDDTPLGRLMHDFDCGNPDKMFYKLIAKKVEPHKKDKEKVIKLAGVMERLTNQARLEGREEGLEEGRQEGLEKGREEGRRETLIESAISMAKKLIVDGGFSLKKIADICELPLEQVRALATNISAQPKE